MITINLENTYIQCENTPESPSRIKITVLNSKSGIDLIIFLDEFSFTSLEKELDRFIIKEQ